MRKYILLIIALCVLNNIMAQNDVKASDEKSGINTVCYGDLNKDGIQDKLVVETPQNKANIQVRDDGYVYNFNQPIMYIYFGSADGYKLYKKYNNVIPRKEVEEECIDYEIGITDKGVLRIGYDIMYSMGSYGTNKHSYLFRYQNGDFFMIGEDYSSMTRNNGNTEDISINYVTHKKQVIKGNAFDEVTPTEKWSKIPAKPLERLGTRNLKVN